MRLKKSHSAFSLLIWNNRIMRLVPCIGTFFRRNSDSKMKRQQALSKTLCKHNIILAAYYLRYEFSCQCNRYV